LFPRKCTYAKVIDLRNMVLWSIGFIANQYRIPPNQISLCPLLYGTTVFLFLFRITFNVSFNICLINSLLSKTGWFL